MSNPELWRLIPSAPAAFKGTYADWKLIRTRRVVQIVMEVPLEASGDAYEVLGGMPNPASEIWCAIARLRKEGDASAERVTTVENAPAPTVPNPQSPARARKSWNEMDYAQQAGVLCGDPKFQVFLRETMPGMWAKSLMYEGANPDDRAAGIVREHCEVMSRSEILPGTKAEQRWNLLVSAYRAREAAERAGAA